MDSRLSACLLILASLPLAGCLGLSPQGAAPAAAIGGVAIPAAPGAAVAALPPPGLPPPAPPAGPGPAPAPGPGPGQPAAPAREGLPPGDTRVTPPQAGDCGRSVGLVGDSITAAAAYQAAMAERCPGTEFVNAPRAYSFAGKNTRQMLADFAGPLAGGHDALVLLGGVNNNGEPERVKADLGAMYDQAAARGIKLVAVTVMPYKGYSSWKPANGESVRAIDDWIRAQAGAGKVAGVVDAFQLFSDPADPDAARAGWTSDRLHPNATGYAALAQEVARALQAAR